MSIRLSESAAQRVRDFLARNPESPGLRFGVRRTGCSGWAYTIDLAGDVAADDHRFEDHGVVVFVDAQSLPLVEGTEIDFVQQGFAAQFVFRNPKAAAECGCGESFTTNEA